MNDTPTDFFEPERFEVTKFQFNTIGWLYTRRQEIDMDPTYQRQGAVWTLEKQRLLIDSLLNRFDVPKIYLHRFARPKRVEARLVRWALVDGKQRLEAIFDFLDGKFTLSSDFVLLDDGSQDAGGLTYRELQDQQPALAAQLQATQLELMEIRTEDLDLVEDMFSRLNEAVPLNAAEKRNAFGGPVPALVRTMVETPFFTQRLPFSNKRYRHYDLAAKFLYWARGQRSSDDGPVRDTKKLRLDAYFKDAKKANDGEQFVEQDKELAHRALELLEGCFVTADELLSSVGMVSVYYLLALTRMDTEKSFPPRIHLAEFEVERRVARRSEEDLTQADLVYLEFARLSQSPNDGAALNYRLAVLQAWCDARAAGEDTRRAIGKLYESLEE